MFLFGDEVKDVAEPDPRVGWSAGEGGESLETVGVGRVADLGGEFSEVGHDGAAAEMAVLAEVFGAEVWWGRGHGLEIITRGLHRLVGGGNLMGREFELRWVRR